LVFTGTAANAGEAIDDGQFVVFLQQKDHPVGQFDALGLGRVEAMKRGDFYVLPTRGLRFGAGKRRSNNRSSKKREKKTAAHDYSAPW
jgi:hypothetical protein